MEVLKKRNKNNDPCTDNWQNYDFDVLAEHVKEMKCRAPYHNSSDHFPLCSTYEELQQAKAFSLNNMELMYPCKIAEHDQFFIAARYPLHMKKVIAREQSGLA